jgi:hypothetical protein
METKRLQLIKLDKADYFNCKYFGFDMATMRQRRLEMSYKNKT